MDSKRFEINKHFPFTQRITKRMAKLMNIFGLTLFRLEKLSFHHLLDVELQGGDICYITGASGSGKSTLLRELFALIDQDNRIRIEDIPLDAERSLIDSVDLQDDSLFATLDVLSAAGLSDVLALLSRPTALSEGQVFRYRLARALLGGAKYVFADEFLSSVDRLSAVVISRNLRRVASQSRRVFVFASSHSDVILDLQPDVIVVKYHDGTTDVRYRDPKRGKKEIKNKGVGVCR
jgi:ABC-type ATPase with predicted acetyltransferase domain